MDKRHNLLVRVADAEYRAAATCGDFVTAELLRDFRRCPELYRQRLSGEEVPEEETAAARLERATRALVFGGRDDFDAEFVVSNGPVNPRTGKAFGKISKAYKSWSSGVDRDVISTEEFDVVLKAQQAVFTHRTAPRLLFSGVINGVARARVADVPCQARADFISDVDGLVSLKFCDALEKFEDDARRRGYVHDLSFCRSVLRECRGETFPVYIIVLERKAPHRCGVWRVADEALDQAEVENTTALHRLLECRKTGRWPHGYEEIQTLTIVEEV